MGILKHLLFWPVTGPLYLLDFSMEKVQGVVREELTDDSQIKAELLELQLLLELGDIDEDQYAEREAVIMSRLRETREWRERFGMGVAGGPVRLAPSADEAAAETQTAIESSTAETDAPQVAQPGEATVDLHLDWDE